MKTPNRTVTAIFLFFCVNSFFVKSPVAAEWETTLSSYFDIVETFDGYANWHGTSYNGCEYDTFDLPLLMDGAPGKWEKSCYYERSDGSTPPTAIADHGAGKRVTGKSVRLNHPGNGLDKGELGLFTRFFGSPGDEFSGYDEVYVFFRMYLPNNAFPTYAQPNASGGCAYDQENPPVVKYIEGNEYYPTASWKWFNINTGWKDGVCFANGDCPPIDNCRYGNNEVHLHLKGGATQNYQKTFALDIFDTPSSGVHWGNPGAIIYNKLIGVELYFKLESALGVCDGVFKGWVYDENGNKTLAFDNAGLCFRPAAGQGCYQAGKTENHKFNRLALESNKHVIGSPYNCGTGMDCDWYLDDLIIDDQEIGPKYYSLLFNQPVINQPVIKSILSK